MPLTVLEFFDGAIEISYVIPQNDSPSGALADLNPKTITNTNLTIFCSLIYTKSWDVWQHEKTILELIIINIISTEIQSMISGTMIYKSLWKICDFILYSPQGSKLV